MSPARDIADVIANLPPRRSENGTSLAAFIPKLETHPPIPQFEAELVRALRSPGRVKQNVKDRIINSISRKPVYRQIPSGLKVTAIKRSEKTAISAIVQALAQKA
jgi:hypothetical protein